MLRFIGPCAEGFAYELENASGRALNGLAVHADGGQTWQVGFLGPGQKSVIKSGRLIAEIRATTER